MGGDFPHSRVGNDKKHVCRPSTRARCSADQPSTRARYGPNMESCVGQTKLSSQIANLSWSARHRGRPIDEDPPPSWTERISLTIQSSQIRSYHDARIKEEYRDGQVKEAIIKELPYWGIDYKYIHHQPNTGYAI